MEVLREIEAAVGRLYTSDSAMEKKQIIAKHYSAEPTFSDPLVYVSGRDNVYAQFRSLPQIFSKIEILFDREKAQVQELPDKLALNLPNVQKYSIRKTWTIEVPCETKLDLVMQEGRWVIDKHQDFWLDKNYLRFIPGYHRFGRHVFGRMSSVLIKMLNGSQ